jgi:hypothetical protein
MMEGLDYRIFQQYPAMQTEAVLIGGQVQLGVRQGE